MSVGVTKDYKLKVRNLRASHTLGGSVKFIGFFFSAFWSQDSPKDMSGLPPKDMSNPQHEIKNSRRKFEEGDEVFAWYKHDRQWYEARIAKRLPEGMAT